MARAHAADGPPGPDDCAVLVQVALIRRVIAVDLVEAHRLKTCNTGREIVRVDDVLERLGCEFISRIAEKAARRFVDPEKPAVRCDVYNTDRRVLERDA